jgi:hypothetical protein
LLKPVRIVCAGAGLVLAWSCTVADKGDYTFDDNPASGGHAATSGSAGNNAGKGGSKGGAAGKGGNAGRAAGGRAGHGGAGEGGAGAGAPPEGGAAGATAGEGGASAGEAGMAGQGGAPASSCDPDPCVHGSCSETSSGFSCACEIGYEGPRCAINHDDCAPNPCLNGGACLDRVNDFKCDCNGTGYSGTTCQTAGPCVANPCENGGVCSATGATTYTCDCTGTGFEGSTCETNHDDCTTTSCVHGTCVDGVNGFTCDCTGTGYEGTTCETNHNDCTTKSCAALGGRCVDLVNGFRCECKSDADCGGAVLSCDPKTQVCRSSITKLSEGTATWPDEACNSSTSFGVACDSNLQADADLWATEVCQNAGWKSGVWTGRKMGGCGNGAALKAASVSMYCGQGSTTTECAEVVESECQFGGTSVDQTIVEFTCIR